MRDPIANMSEWRRPFLRAAYELSGGDMRQVLPLNQIAEAMDVDLSDPNNVDGIVSIAKSLTTYGYLWKQHAGYEAVSITAAGIQEAERQSSVPINPFGGIEELRRRFLGAIYAIAGGNPAQHVSWVDVAPWMGWDRDDMDRFDDALAIADYLERSGLITVESDAGSIYLITEEGLSEVEADPAISMPPEILATPDEFSTAAPVGETPVEIQESLDRFRVDHPDPAKAAFIMMPFGRTRAHAEITEAVRSGLAAHDIRGVRADDKRYHDHLFYNILTYLHGCGLGIAIYERIETEAYNPNVALEVGYLFAMRKPVCLLKDQTLVTLPSDLVGQLYDPFDPQNPGGTIPSVVSRWLRDKGLD